MNSKYTQSKFVTNIYNPTAIDAKEKLVAQETVFIVTDKKRDATFDFMQQWIAAHNIGDPIQTKTRSKDRLISENIIGLYAHKHTDDLISAIRTDYNFKKITLTKKQREERAAILLEMEKNQEEFRESELENPVHKFKFVYKKARSPSYVFGKQLSDVETSTFEEYKETR